MDKFIIVNEDWEEQVLEKRTNPKAFDTIIKQKLANVRRIILEDPEGWTLGVSSEKIILIN